MNIRQGLGAVVLLLVFVAGCSSGPGDKTLDYNFKQGVGGVSMTFQQNAPAEKLFPGSKFKIIVNLQNEGAYELKDPVLKVIGLKPQYFRLNTYEQSVENLQGKSITNPTGDRVFVEFDGITGNLFENAVQEVNPYALKLSYRSTVEFEDTVCINSNLYEVYDAGCEVREQKSYGGQGAPVGVQQLQQIMYPEGAGGRVEFRFVVSNLGQGTVKYVNLGPAKIGNQPLDCRFEGVVESPQSMYFDPQRQEALVTCQMVLRDQRAYTTTLTLDLAYDYEIKEFYQLNLVNPKYSTGSFI